MRRNLAESLILVLPPLTLTSTFFMPTLGLPQRALETQIAAAVVCDIYCLAPGHTPRYGISAIFTYGER